MFGISSTAVVFTDTDRRLIQNIRLKDLSVFLDGSECNSGIVKDRYIENKTGHAENN
jgi:hypothetical protein